MRRKRRAGMHHRHGQTRQDRADGGQAVAGHRSFGKDQAIRLNIGPWKHSAQPRKRIVQQHGGIGHRFGAVGLMRGTGRGNQVTLRILTQLLRGRGDDMGQ